MKRRAFLSTSVKVGLVASWFSAMRVANALADTSDAPPRAMLCEVHPDGGLRNIEGGATRSGPLRVRTRGLMHAQTCMAFELRAHFDDTTTFVLFAHQTAIHGNAVQSSVPVLVHWQQADASGLRLGVSGAHGMVSSCALPARVGNYVLLLDARPGDARRLEWCTSDTGACRRIALRHTSGAAYARPYLLLGVEREA